MLRDSFNPTLVRLRPTERIVQALVESLGFNPTLVRLRRAGPSPGCCGPPGFQSHAGSIEAPQTIGNIRPDQMGGLVSIPRWFD